jgi:hypothetical protein
MKQPDMPDIAFRVANTNSVSQVVDFRKGDDKEGEEAGGVFL